MHERTKSSLLSCMAGAILGISSAFLVWFLLFLAIPVLMIRPGTLFGTQLPRRTKAAASTAARDSLC